jgi:tRNA-dihydrouridine synthase
MKVKTKIIGNGDVTSLTEAKKLMKQTGCDGVMIGRGIFGNPWFFNSSKKKITLEEKLKVLVEHTNLFEKLEGHYKNFAVMKKHYKAYVNDFSGAKELRLKLMETENAKEVEKIVSGFLSNS